MVQNRRKWFHGVYKNEEGWKNKIVIVDIIDESTYFR